MMWYFSVFVLFVASANAVTPTLTPPQRTAFEGCIFALQEAINICGVINDNADGDRPRFRRREIASTR